VPDIYVFIYLGTARDSPTPLVRGKMEGWARIRIAGQTDWKRVWMSVQEGTESNDNPVPGNTLAPTSATIKKKRASLFSRDSGARNDLFPKPVIAMFASTRAKDRKKPIMTVWNVTQAFGVYPERPELISRSTLMKVEGTFGDDDIAANLRLREGWVLIMPEIEGNEQAKEMLKWIVGEF
jgi:CCR4-NOT transcriptional complex subunit CAF120